MKFVTNGLGAHLQKVARWKARVECSRGLPIVVRL